MSNSRDPKLEDIVWTGEQLVDLLKKNSHLLTQQQLDDLSYYTTFLLWDGEYGSDGLDDLEVNDDF